MKSKIKTFPVYSISVCGRLSWQLHALNNEGNEGNQSITRRYYIVQKNDENSKSADVVSVNGVSGDMVKHIQAEHLHRICMEDELSLSEGGKQFHPDRIGYDISDTKTFKPATRTIKITKKDKKGGQEKEVDKEEIMLDESITQVIQKCTISDLEGFMVTLKRDKPKPQSESGDSATESATVDSGKTIKRESVIEFGSIVGLPNHVKTQSYFHAKYGPENPTPYNVQLSSGLYATVINIEAFRIGYNPHTFKYAIDATERKKRLDALLKSVLYTYLQPNGAKRNTNLPHIDDFQGIITVSTRRCPAPMLSPLNNSYRDEIDSLKETLNKINGEGTIASYRFDSLAQFGDRIAELLELAQPWESENAETIE